MTSQNRVKLNCDVIANFSLIFRNSDFLMKTTKAIGFKSLRLSCSDIIQVNIKMRNVSYC